MSSVWHISAWDVTEVQKGGSLLPHFLLLLLVQPSFWRAEVQKISMQSKKNEMKKIQRKNMLGEETEEQQTQNFFF